MKKSTLYLIVGLVGVLIYSIIVFFAGPGIIKLELLPWGISKSDQGQIGDLFGGTTGPMIAWMAAVLTFAAFWVQYKANEQQREQFEKTLQDQKEASNKQDTIWRTERFEDRFFELLKLHKSNVSEMNIAGRVLGRKCFVQMFYELKFCYEVSEDFLNTLVKASNENKEKYSNFDLMGFAYTIFFYGVGYYSEKHYSHRFNIAEKDLFSQLKPFFEKIQNDTLEYLGSNGNKKIYEYNSPRTSKPGSFNIEFYYYPFDGHINRLGHYYRHLFQTTNYVISQDFIEDKYSYIKTLRAQLSNFEQLMLYYNALAWFQGGWKEIFTEYRFIKNIPIPLADFDISPEVLYAKEIETLRQKGIEMFEWHESE
ncbi:MAG: putative phage abortive infection protein [Bacteroidetes bacterium]|nr:putative phage abortive infection protein [Bacteroidota bacterium]